MSYYQNVPVVYPVYTQTTNYTYSYSQRAVNAAITGAVVGAIAGTANGISKTEKGSKDRVKNIAKIAGRDTAVSSVSSLAGAMASGLIGTKGLLSAAVFTAAGVGAGYVFNKYVPACDVSACDKTETETEK